MKRMFLVMAIAIVTVVQVSAQDGNRQMTAQQRTEQRIKQMNEKLNLTDEQETKIRELYADFNKQMMEQAIAEMKKGRRDKVKE